MHIKLPYAFQVTGKVPGSRRMDRVIAADWLSVNVATASFLDAPVCISWTRRHDFNFFEDHAVGEEGRVDIRTFNGNFYRPLTGMGTPMRAEDIVDRILIDYEPHSDKPEQLVLTQVSFAINKGGYPRPSFVGETLSNEQDIAQALTEKAEGLLFLDGTVWERCPEPVLIAEEDFVRDPTIFISPGFLDKYTSGRSRYFTFAIDESEEALAFAEGRTAPAGEEIAIHVSAEITTVVSELLSRYHVADDAVRHATEALRSGGAVELNRASPDYIRSWMNFQEALASATLTQDDREIQLLVDAWVEFAEENHESNGAPAYDLGLTIAQAMQTRFADRTMEPGTIFQNRPKL
ncbi:hypothetical protein [Rhizobium sp. BK176]|uniref:hypothetical protein n=1 Tax=Rhizobium sp. BK176 TaxID=2587071 RepID=UPI00216908CF|nr:hypothetical protein [Rhizobium sp. BK176]MCS4089713.1 hypothetical protein [Rhizobium sp. BK176]